jgi:conjugal transfer pilus assembly protein TraB
MTEPDTKAAATEPRETQQSGLASLNARTAKRQQLLLAGVGAVLLGGASWFIFGSDDSPDGADPKAAQTIETAGLVNRDLSQREFVAVYGNRLEKR